MEKEDILLVANDAIINFPYEIKQPIIMFLEKKRFSKYLDLMTIKKHLNKTPCFVAEMNNHCIIYYCPEIIEELTNQHKISKKDFIKAITIHELCHIYNNLKADNKDNAIASELIVHEEMKKIFPKEQKILIMFS